MVKNLYCSSCKLSVKNDTGSTTFICPNCGKEEIIRCSHCRKISARYECTKCKFSGPN